MNKIRFNAACLALCGVLFSAAAAYAETASGAGKVQKVDSAAAKVTIQQAPMAALDMPDAMTMVYAVKDPAMLKSIKAGDNVTFDVDHGDAGFVLTRIQKK